MFPHALKLTVFALVVAVSGAAQANEWTRTGPNGTMTRTYDPETGISINRSGANGGSTSATVTCSRGSGVVCQRAYSRVRPDGQTVSGTRTTRRGLFRKRSVNTVTRPDGTTTTRIRAAPQYSVRRPGLRVNRAVRR